MTAFLPLGVDQQLNLYDDAPNLLPLETTGSQPMPPDISAQRALKASIGDPQADQASIASSIASGDEGKVREQLSWQAAQRRTVIAQAQLTNLVKKMGRPLTQAEADEAVRQFQLAQLPPDHDSVIEEQYAQASMTHLFETFKDEPDSENAQLRKTPDVLAAAEAAGKLIQSKTEFALTQVQNTAQLMAQQSWGGWGIDMVTMAIPGVSEYKLRGNVPGTGFFEGGLRGHNLEAQRLRLISLPFPEYKKEFLRILDSLSGNPTIAHEFAKSMYGMSTEDVWVNNGLSVFDASIAPSLAKSLGAGVLYRGSKDAIKSYVKRNPSTRAEMAEAAGDTVSAGIQKETQAVVNELKGSVPIETEANKTLPRYLRSDAEAVAEGPVGRLDQGIRAKIRDVYERRIGEFMSFLNTSPKVQRLPELVTEMMEGIQAEFKSIYKGVSNRILNIDHQYVPITNTHYVAMRLGQNDGSLFVKPSDAYAAAVTEGIRDAVVLGRQGNGFYLTYTAPLREDSKVVRDFILHTKNSKAPDSPIGWLLGKFQKFRGPEELLSRDEMVNRKTTTYAANKLLEAADEEIQTIKALYQAPRKGLPKQNPDGSITPSRAPIALMTPNERKEMKRNWQEFGRTLNVLAKTPDPDNPNKMGTFFRNVGDMDDFYLRHYDRVPSPLEVDAYWAFKRLMEYDRIFREISLYKNMSRKGVEQHTIVVKGPNGELVKSPPIQGILMDHMPGGEDAILVMGKNLGEETIYSYALQAIKASKKEASVAQKEAQNTAFPVTSEEQMLDLAGKVKEGLAKVIRIFDVEQKPLEGFSKIKGQPIRYVVVENIETKPLTFDLLPRRGGGHIEYDYDFYIKQAKITKVQIGEFTRHNYEGDTTLMPMQLRAVGQAVAKQIDEVRKFLKLSDEAADPLIKAKHLQEAIDYHTKTGMPMSWKELDSWFKPRWDHDKKKMVDPVLNLDEPIQLIKKDQSIGSISAELEKRYPPGTFRDNTRHGSDAKQYQVQFTGERDAWEVNTVKDIGTRHNPVYAYEPAQIVDPILSVNRSLQRIIHNQAMDDQKIFSMEHWLKAAENYLDVKQTSEIWSSPHWYFNNPQGPKWRSDAPAAITNKLTAEWFQMRQFIGTPSSKDTVLHSIAEGLANSVYTTFGPKAERLTPSWLIPQIAEFPALVRSMTFHASMGVFALPQFFVQQATYATIFGVAGMKHATSGTAATFFHQWSRYNKHPNSIAGYDKMLTNFGWKPGEFIEARNLLDQSGFGTLGREYAVNDTFFNPKYINNGFHDFLDAGTIFFKGGERNVRFGAWYTAYREFRDINPTKQITRRDMQFLVDRADLLSGNMSRASSSALHTGVMSIPAQFLAYQIRLGELFLGKRVDTATRMRMALVYSTMFGGAGAAGLTGLPLSDSIRRAALENDYIVGEKWLSSIAMEGVPAYLTALITGKGDYKSGQWYNWSDRYSPQGLEFVQEALRGDKPLWSILGGAAFSKISGTFEQSHGLFSAMLSGIRDDGKHFPITAADFSDAAKEITSWNAAHRLYVAMNTGKWMSKKGNYLTDVDKISAGVMTALGLQPQAVADLHLLAWNLKDKKKLEELVEKRFVKEFARGMQAHIDNNPEQGKKHFTRAFTFLHAGGYPDDRFDRAVAKAIDENSPLAKRMDWNYYIRTPRENADALAKAKTYSTKTKLEDQRKQMRLGNPQ